MSKYVSISWRSISNKAGNALSLDLVFYIQIITSMLHKIVFMFFHDNFSEFFELYIVNLDQRLQISVERQINWWLSQGWIPFRNES